MEELTYKTLKGDPEICAYIRQGDAVLGALALILYGTGIIIFCRRDLPL